MIDRYTDLDNRRFTAIKRILDRVPNAVKEGNTVEAELNLMREERIAAQQAFWDKIDVGSFIGLVKTPPDSPNDGYRVRGTVISKAGKRNGAIIFLVDEVEGRNKWAKSYYKIGSVVCKSHWVGSHRTLELDQDCCNHWETCPAVE